MYSFPNFKIATVEIWIWIRKFISHLKMDVIPYLYVSFIQNDIYRSVPGVSSPNLAALIE